MGEVEERGNKRGGRVLVLSLQVTDIRWGERGQGEVNSNNETKFFKNLKSMWDNKLPYRCSLARTCYSQLTTHITHYFARNYTHTHYSAYNFGLFQNNGDSWRVIPPPPNVKRPDDIICALHLAGGEISETLNDIPN